MTITVEPLDATDNLEGLWFVSFENQPEPAVSASDAARGSGDGASRMPSS